MKELEIEKTTFVIIGKTFGNRHRLALHNVRKGKICEEVPFTKESAKGIFSIFSDHRHTPKHFKGIIPKEVLIARDERLTGTVLMWTCQEGKKNLQFSKHTGVQKEEFYLPTLIFCLKGTSIYIMACNYIVHTNKQ